MISIRTQGDFSKLKNELGGFSAVDYMEINEVIGEILIEGTDQRFKTGKSPEGKKWKTSIRASREGGKTLIKDSDLRGSITKKVTPEGVAIGTNKVYARIHQKGGTYTIRAKTSKGLRFKYNGKWVTKKQVTVTMPKRPYLGISEEELLEINALLKTVIGEHVK